jgi:hypothetical protein
MSIFASPRFLRTVLIADAASGAVTALLQLTAAGLLAEFLGLSPGLLVGSGIVLLFYIAGASWLANCDPIPRGGTWLLIVANWMWVGGCVTLLLTGAASTGLGQAYLVMQAVAVAALAELQWFGVRARRTSGSAALA